MAARACAFSGLALGEKRDGAFSSPAMIAASRSVSSAAGLLK